MSRSFTYHALPMRVAFGDGTLRTLVDEVEALGLERLVILSTPEQVDLAERAAGFLGGRAVRIHPEARMHVPDSVAEQACAVAQELAADGCVAIGGGSTIGLGKAIALKTRLPIIAIPTTYAGSEMTPVWGLTDGSVKRTGRDPIVLPRSVIYDVSLTSTLPRAVSIQSGINAMAHAVEALYAPDRSPIISLMAEESIRAMANALPLIAATGGAAPGRSDALYAAWLAGSCLGATTMGLHHKLCHTLGGALDLPHAATHSILLPHVFAFNAAAAPEAAAAVSRALGTSDPIGGFFDLTHSLDAPRSLSDLGVPKERLGELAELATRSAYANPRPFDQDDIMAILQAAF
jgi:maleylacetate reductase